MNRDQNFRLIEIDVASSAVFLMSRDARQIPFLAPNVTLMLGHSCFRSTCGFSDVGVPRVIFAVTRQLVDDSFWRELHFVLSTYHVLEFGTGCENDLEPSFA